MCVFFPFSATQNCDTKQTTTHLCAEAMEVTTDRKGYAPMFGVNLHGTGCHTVGGFRCTNTSGEVLALTFTRATSLLFFLLQYVK